MTDELIRFLNFRKEVVDFHYYLIYLLYVCVRMLTAIFKQYKP